MIPPLMHLLTLNGWYTDKNNYYTSASNAPCIQTISPSLSVCHMTHCIPPCCMEWKWCCTLCQTKVRSPQLMLGLSVWNCRPGFWRNVMRKHFKIKPHSGSHQILSDLCIDTTSDIVLTVGQFGEPISGSSKIHIKQLINQWHRLCYIYI